MDEVKPRVISVFDPKYNEDGEVVASGQDERGREIPDPVPTAPPIGYVPGPSLGDTIQRLLKHQLMAQAAAAEGFDTFEEAEDFDIPDDPIDPETPYEEQFDPIEAAARRGLLDDEFRAGVLARRKLLRPDLYTENEDGAEPIDEGGNGDRTGGPGGARAVGKSQPKPGEKSPDKGGVRQTPRNDPKPEE